MKELTVARRKSRSHAELIQVLKSEVFSLMAFYNDDETKSYRSRLDAEEECFVLTMYGDQTYTYYFASEDGRRYLLRDIVPEERKLSRTEYDRRVESVAELLLSIGKAKRVFLVKQSDSAERLDRIIGSKIARDRLERILKAHPNSCDKNALHEIDVFTNELYRYSRRETDVALLREHLEKHRKLDGAYVERICERIDIGLHVLDVNNAKTAP
jgi:hypothetical protein